MRLYLRAAIDDIQILRRILWSDLADQHVMPGAPLAGGPAGVAAHHLMAYFESRRARFSPIAVAGIACPWARGGPAPAFPLTGAGGERMIDAVQNSLDA